jgi:ABC-type antimicrobial peptide transport system permease subunit
MREAGIRAALGAPGITLTTLMLRDTAIGAAIGITIGVGIAVLLARALTPYLFGVRAGDPISYLAAFVVLGVTTVAATIPPARRAARVNPVRVLRVE